MLMSRLPDDSVFAKELQISAINIRTCICIDKLYVQF